VKKIKLEIIALSYSQTQSGAYALVLGEAGGKRRLPIIIGGFEAQAIAIQLENMTPSRPLTHDLFKTFAGTFGIEVKEVIIYKIVEGVFYAKLVAEREGLTEEIDARTSDAIAIALRFDCPINTFDNILSSYGILLDEEPARSEPAVAEIGSGLPESEFSRQTEEELEKLLNDALEDEDYEKASKLRDELTKRRGS
jgi:bifunctional DNase/RNase